MTRTRALAAYYRRLAASGKYPPAMVAALLARANEVEHEAETTTTDKEKAA